MKTLLTVCLCLLALGCQSPAEKMSAPDAGCSTDNDCKGSRVCENGRCVDADAGLEDADAATPDSSAADSGSPADAGDVDQDAGCVPACAGRCGGDDLCGGTCPDACIPPETCGGSGTVGVCGCTPQCDGLCGGPNGCGLDCPDTCVYTDHLRITCGGGGVENVCGCTPDCSSICANYDDHCGGICSREWNPCLDGCCDNTRGTGACELGGTDTACGTAAQFCEDCTATGKHCVTGACQ